MGAHTCDPSYSGGWGRRIAWTQEAGGCSELRWCHCTPACVTEQDPVSKQNKAKNPCTKSLFIREASKIKVHRWMEKKDIGKHRYCNTDATQNKADIAIRKYLVNRIWKTNYSKFIYGVACVSTSFLSINKRLYVVWTYHVLIIHSTGDRHLGCFPLSALVNSIATDIRLQGFIWTPVFKSLGYILRSGSAGSYDIFV